MTDLSLDDLGWAPFFAKQLTEDDAGATPMRVTKVQRSRLHLLGVAGAAKIFLPSHIHAGDCAVGDWVLVAEGAITRVLERQRVLTRKAAGREIKPQLIAANVDTIFIVSSCNEDFNLPRLERYVALALEGEAQPVVVLTKADQVPDPGEFAAKARRISPLVLVECVDARDAAELSVLESWCKTGQTVAMLGSSGVGKSTIANAISDADQATQGIREDDAKGRHTTTQRSLHRLKAGGWLMDTPGMRELALFDAADGIDQVFEDIAALALTCKFRNCAHEGEPGCAIDAALEGGEVDPGRVARWRKLKAEDEANTLSIAETRKRQKNFSKHVKTVVRSKHKKRDS